MSIVATPIATPIDMEPRAYARTMRRILVLLMAVGVAIRIVRLIVPSPIWDDEARLALNILDRDYAGLAQQLDYYQVAPILFLWAERFMMVELGTQDWVLRLVPFFAAIAGLLFFWDFARRTVSPTAATIAVGIMAVSLWPITMAATVKPYSCDLFCSALLLSLAARWHQRPERLRPLVALALSVPFTLASSYPTVFVAGGVSLYLFPVAWKSSRSRQAWFLIYNLAMLATFAVIYATVGKEQVDSTKGSTGLYMQWYWKDDFPPDSSLEWPHWFLLKNTGRLFAHPWGDGDGCSTATTLLFLAGVWWCWRNGSRPLLAACLVPFALNLTAAFLHKYPYGGCWRISQHLAPSICLLAGVGWAYVLELYAPRRTDRLWHVKCIAGILIAIAVAGLLHAGVKSSHDDISRFGARLHGELKSELLPGDRIVVRDLTANLGYMNASPLWYIRCFGDRVIDRKAGEPLPAAERLWLLTFFFSDDLTREEHRRSIESAQGWQSRETFSYTIRPSNGRGAWFCATITCLVHPGDERPAPKFNIVP
ncbi:MAG TPA: glycosyltransferase family 39 protein [Gemmata sp.]|nr:glycosyltransferase family 39 protein [Gemmata sp.]